MKLQILTPEKIVFDGNVRSITLPGALGSFTVLEHHAPLISFLDKGDLKYILDDGRESKLTIDSGFAEVKLNEVIVCVETI